MAKRNTAAVVKVAKVAKVNGKNALERACQRAQAAGLVVVGRGFRKRDYALVWMVPSQSEANRWHMVTEIEGQLECDCHAGQYGRLCIHRAVVYLDLTAEAQTFAARRQAQAQAETPTDDARDTAPLYRSNAPFSLFKA
jgi:hypothetical protein